MKQKDSKGRRYKVSHLCHANRDDLCLEIQHIELELGTTNARRIKHQNGNDVGTCAKYGDPSCMSTGTIGGKAFNDDGVHH